VDSAPEVLARALPLLAEAEVAFKVAASPAVLAALNEGEAGLAQVGKFLTAYPADDAAAVRLAVALDRATDGLRGPRVATDRALRPGGLVHYRFGSFTGPEDAPEPPAPALDPFASAGVAQAEERGAIAGRYVLVSALHRSAGGSVHLAADLRLGAPCVVKRAGRDARVGPDGRDARDRLRREADVLERLAPDPRFPAVRDLVEDEDGLCLVMDELEGTLLGRLVEGPWPVERVVALGRRLAAALGAIHAAGLVYRDLGPQNVLVGSDGSVRLVDFELARPVGALGETAGTPGYAPPEQLAGSPARIADDVFALGGVLALLATGTDPGTSPVDVPDERLSRIVAGCRQDDLGSRFASMAEVDAALTELEAAP
jgi:hypothetical protein